MQLAEIRRSNAAPPQKPEGLTRRGWSDRELDDGVGARGEFQARAMVRRSGLVERFWRDILRCLETVVSFQVVASQREGIEDARGRGIFPQSATNQLQIRFKNFFAQFGEKHQSLAEVTELCFEGDRLPSVVTI